MQQARPLAGCFSAGAAASCAGSAAFAMQQPRACACVAYAGGAAPVRTVVVAPSAPADVRVAPGQVEVDVWR
eukprot:2452216-Prymnesium_polylepis.1